MVVVDGGGSGGGSSLSGGVVSSVAVVSVFGPPRTATMGRLLGPPPTFWHAETWYYPIDGRTRSAMAIRFAGNVAADVEFLTVPAGVRE